MPNTIQIHRVLCVAPEKVYRTFLDPEAMAKWQGRVKAALAR